STRMAPAAKLPLVDTRGNAAYARRNPESARGHHGGAAMAGGPTGVIGRGIQIKGSLSGSGDVLIEGRVEGQINIRDGVTIEDGGVVRADVEAASVVIQGEMAGNVDVHDRVRITNGAKLVGDIRAPKVILEDGARFNGSIEMEVKLPEGI